MSSLSRPPQEISLGELFTTWLPSAFAQARAAGAHPSDATLGFELTGDGGGAWTVRVRGGALTVDDGVDRAAALIVRQTVADFRALVWGEGDIPALVPPSVDLGAALAGGGRVSLAAFAQVKGTLAIEVPGYHGRTWRVSLTLAGAATPQASVSADLATLDQIRRGELAVAPAFFGGKITLGGDVAWLMQTGMGLAGSFGGGFGGMGGGGQPN